MPPPLLQLEKVTIRFGGLTAVNAVDFAVNEGELCGLIGPNGAGKTTVFNLVTGVYQPTEGTVSFAGGNLAGLRVNEIVERGIARTFQNIRLFGSLSVFDNVRVACNLHRGTSPIHSLIRLKAFSADEAACTRRVEELLEIFNLRRFRDAPAKSAASDAMSKALLGYGCKFVGSTICYAFMQATGMVDDHEAACMCRTAARR